MTQDSKQTFDIKIVGDNFEAALHEDDDVLLQHYLESFEELNKFFTLMGTVFGFVSKDLKAKMDLLNEYLNSTDHSEYFKSVKKMIEYEKEKELLSNKDHVSGARTLLRLHRGLDFIQQFLKKIGDLQNEESTSTACREAYDDTLAKHHTFIIRNGARVAIYTLPTKIVLLKKVCGDQEEIERAMELLPKALESTSIVFNRIETLYTVHDLHQLP